MARLQILELPTEHHGNDMVTPFVLVIDRVQNSETMLDFLRDPPHLRDELGARTVLVFDEEVEIPANETSADPEPEAVSEPDYTEMATLVGRALGIDITVGEPDVAGWLRTACRELLKSDDARAHLQDELSDARLWARHGYEIGQKHCGWTDHGTAPVWLTDGWPNSFDACEHLKRAAELEASEDVRKRVAKEQKAALLDALGMDPTRDWDDIRNAAAGIREQRDTQAAELERLRAGEEPVTDNRVTPTPAQWIWHWNQAAPEKRLSMAAQIMTAMATADVCFTADHEVQIATLRAEVGRLRGERSTGETPDA